MYNVNQPNVLVLVKTPSGVLIERDGNSLKLPLACRLKPNDDPFRAVEAVLESIGVISKAKLEEMRASENAVERVPTFNGVHLNGQLPVWDSTIAVFTVDTDLLPAEIEGHDCTTVPWYNETAMHSFLLKEGNNFFPIHRRAIMFALRCCYGEKSFPE